MKNIFDYATKELSQDAFLMWLFESFDDEEIGEVSCKILRSICELDGGEKIENVITTAQQSYIDISAVIETKSERIYLFIEDKVFSKEHNQLKNYNEAIEKIIKAKEKKATGKNVRTVKIFYKTAVIEEKEKAAIEEAGWEHLDIFKVCKLFKDVINKNIILKSYIDHINELKRDFETKEQPEKKKKFETTKKDLRKWAGFFYNCIIPNINDEFSWELNYQTYDYAFLKIKEKGKKEIPHIELNSSFFRENEFDVFILCSDAKEADYKDNKDRVIEKIKAEGKMVNKNCKQQLGKKAVRFENTEDLSNKLNEYLDYYKEIISIWENGENKGGAICSTLKLCP